jgi:hypothetical protein
MTHIDINSAVPTNATLHSLPRRSQKQLLTAYWVATIALLLYEIYAPNTASILLNLVAVLVTSTALVSSYLWCAGKVHGLPIFPLFALTFIWTHALPLITANPGVEVYSVDRRLFAGCTTALFLALGTFIWFQFVKSVPPLPKAYRAFGDREGTQFFLAALAISTLFNVANAGGWLPADPGVFAILRGIVLALTALSAFVLAYRLGTQTLSKQQATLFVVLLVSFILSNAIGFLLVGAATVSLIAISAFIIGRKKLPILMIVVMLLCLSLLHSGKGEMRAKYWFSLDRPTYVQPWEYPAIYVEWLGTSLKHFNPFDRAAKPPQGQSFLERSSVIQMLMLAQEKSPYPIPYLYGKTYQILPELLIPRILNPSKIRSHEGTFILNIHYGRQTYKDTLITTIGWGLLAESYANFGWLGCAGLAVVLGAAYGQATRWSINAPILSLQSLFAVILLTFAIQSEWSAGVYIAALAQYSTVLIGLAFFLMKSCRVSTYLTHDNGA